MQPKRIIAVHLLNDWSGSPLVFRQALEALQQANNDIVLFAGTPSGSGFLSNMAGITTTEIRYKWHPSKLLTLWYYLSIQLSLFVKFLFFLRSTDQVYINTLLPFGAALAGWLRGCRVVYHIHEVSIKPWLLKSWLTAIANLTARQVVFVSEYTRRQTALVRPFTCLIYNALPESFTSRASQVHAPNMSFPFTTLMLCSNKAYKGIHEFVETARKLPQIRFLLVLNETEAGVEGFVCRTNPPANCFVFPAQTDTIPFYQQAHVVLNLSHPNAWVETFGMTILEAMACGRPVIVPTVGGICELIVDSVEGFNVNVFDSDVLVERLQRLSSTMGTYLRMSRAARERAQYFSAHSFQQQIISIFNPYKTKETAL